MGGKPAPGTCHHLTLTATLDWLQAKGAPKRTTRLTSTDSAPAVTALEERPSVVAVVVAVAVVVFAVVVVVEFVGLNEALVVLVVVDALVVQIALGAALFCPATQSASASAQPLLSP